MGLFGLQYNFILSVVQADRSIFKDHMIQVYLFCLVFLYLTLTRWSVAAFDCVRAP